MLDFQKTSSNFTARCFNRIKLIHVTYLCDNFCPPIRAYSNRDTLQLQLHLQFRYNDHHLNKVMICKDLDKNSKGLIISMLMFCQNFVTLSD